MPERQNRPLEEAVPNAFRGADTTLPDAPVVAVTRDRCGVRTVTVSCPFCGRPHVHGWPEGDDAPGVRLAHCAPRREPWRNPSPTPPVPREYRIGVTP